MDVLLHYIGGFTPYTLLLNFLNFNLDVLCNIPHPQAVSLFFEEEELSETDDVILPA